MELYQYEYDEIYAAVGELRGMERGRSSSGGSGGGGESETLESWEE